MNEEERRKLEAQYQEAMEKKKHHPKVNHPGSVDQMEDVWENVDHLEADQFSPKAFFKLHDINSDGFLDEGEIEAIMLKEVCERFDLKKFRFFLFSRQKKFMKMHQKQIPLKKKKKWIECGNM